MPLTDTSQVSEVTIQRKVGSSQKVGTPTSVKVLEVDSANNVTRAEGTTIPTDADAGFAKGCAFIKTNGGVATTLHINEGSETSCDFNAVESSASTVTAVVAGNGLAGGGTEGSVTLDVNVDDSTIELNADAIRLKDAGTTRAKLSAAAARKSQSVVSATVATTGNADAYMIVPETGVLSSVDFSGVDALAANDTNYITFTITNLGQAGAGSTVMLAATAANTTKATGGAALSANTKRSLTLTAVGADLNVVAGDRLLIRAAVTGTLANTVTFPAYALRFGGTT